MTYDSHDSLSMATFQVVNTMSGTLCSMDYQHKLAKTKNKIFSKFANGDELFQGPKAINTFCNM